MTLKAEIMDVYKFSERLMAMDDASWARHANPMSVFSRFSCLPLIVLAIWSRVWLGWWAMLPIGLALLWVWINPRMFGPPKTFDHWASKGVMGERLFLDRKSGGVAEHHIRMAHILSGMSAGGVAILVYGLIVLDFWAVMCGMALSILPKVWFVDRMVWIFDDAHMSADQGP